MDYAALYQKKLTSAAEVPILPYGSIFWYGYYSTKVLIKKVILHPVFLHQL